MIPQRRFIPKSPIKEDDGCIIEIKRTASGGKKIKIGKNCTREQIKMLQESGQIKIEDLGE